jgi:hypothetical protein
MDGILAALPVGLAQVGDRNSGHRVGVAS